MNYSEYYEKCKQKYSIDTGQPRIQEKELEFYTNPVRQYDFFSNKNYEKIINNIANQVSSDFEVLNDSSHDGIMIKHENIWKLQHEIDELCNIFVPVLEEKMYFCNLYVDKVYVYRTVPMDERRSSYIWHYDNNPLEVVKTIFYLSDVNGDENSPYEYCIDSEERGVLCSPSRTGPKHWLPAPNNSRVDHVVESLSKNNEKISKKVLGKVGTSCTFNNNVIHRANPVLKNFRDVINIRVKPTLNPAPKYADKRWTTGFEKPGVVNPNPTLAWSRIV